MSPKQTLQQVQRLTEVLVGLSLCNEQNFVATRGDPKNDFEITVSTASSTALALKNVAYQDIYHELETGRCFNFKMLDGALILLRYRFHDGEVCEHSLSYFPSPDLEHFQNEPELYLEDELYADIIAKNIVSFPIRFDFSSDSKKFVEVDHPYSHLTLGQYANCRIPVCSPVGPFLFAGFILRNFYNTAYRKYSEKIPVSSAVFKKTITTKEKKIPHLVCS